MKDREVEGPCHQVSYQGGERHDRGRIRVGADCCKDKKYSQRLLGETLDIAYVMM